MKVPQALKSILIGSYSNIDAIKKFLSLPLKGEGWLNGPFYYGRASKTPRGKKHSSTIYLFQLPVEYLLSKKKREGKKMGGDETFLLKKKKKER